MAAGTKYILTVFWAVFELLVPVKNLKRTLFLIFLGFHASLVPVLNSQKQFRISCQSFLFQSKIWYFLCEISHKIHGIIEENNEEGKIM